jgi:hypothetical protein
MRSFVLAALLCAGVLSPVQAEQSTFKQVSAKVSSKAGQAEEAAVRQIAALKNNKNVQSQVRAFDKGFQATAGYLRKKWRYYFVRLNRDLGYIFTKDQYKKKCDEFSEGLRVRP